MKIREANAAAAFAACAEEYDRWYEDSLVYEQELAAIKLLAPPRAHPAVEIGCGTGRFSRVAGVDLGIDPAEECLMIAQRRGITTIKAEAEALPLAEAGAGSVFFFFSLCFVRNKRLALAEATRVLRDGGSMTVAIINRESELGREIIKKKSANHPLYRYANLLTPGELAKLLNQARLEVTAAVSCLKTAKATDTPRPGIDPQAGCVIICAQKQAPRGHISGHLTPNHQA